MFGLFKKKPQYLCLQCHMVAEPYKETPGSGCVELALYLVLCFPGIIYSAWRISCKYDVCPYCESRSLVPENSPAARKIRGG